MLFIIYSNENIEFQIHIPKKEIKSVVMKTYEFENRDDSKQKTNGNFGLPGNENKKQKQKVWNLILFEKRIHSTVNFSGTNWAGRVD